MKRSTAIILLSVGAGAVAWYALRDPGKTAEAMVFRTVQDCVLGSGMAETACREQYREALSEHERTAPRYANRSECETEFGAGACERRQTSTGSVFMPLLAGYMFGQMTAGRPAVPSQPLYPARPDQACQPDASGQVPPNCPRPGASSSSSGSGTSGRSYRTGHGTVIIWDGRTTSTTSTTTSGGRTTTTTRPSTVSVPRTVATPPPSRPNTVARDGFGQTSRSLSMSSRSSGT